MLSVIGALTLKFIEIIYVRNFIALFKINYFENHQIPLNNFLYKNKQRKNFLHKLSKIFL